MDSILESRPTLLHLINTLTTVMSVYGDCPVSLIGGSIEGTVLVETPRGEVYVKFTQSPATNPKFN